MPPFGICDFYIFLCIIIMRRIQQNWNLQSCSVSGLRADAVRVLAPRIYEGGGTSPQTGTGGSTNYGPNTVKLNQFSAFFVLFLILFKICIGRTPPAPVCALGHPPHKCGGRGRLRRQPCKFQFLFLRFRPGKTVHNLFTDFLKIGLAFFELLRYDMLALRKIEC